MKTRLILALVAAAPLAAQATDGYFANGYGMKSIGMGGAAVAVAQEPFGGAVNPGAMSMLGNEWQLGASWFQPLREASRTGSGQAGIDGVRGQRVQELHHPRVRRQLEIPARPRVRRHGLRQRRDEHRLSGRPDLRAERVRESFRQERRSRPYNLLCGNGNLGVDLMQLMIAPYVSWEFMKGQSIGIAPIIAYQRFKAKGLQAFDNPVLSTSPGNVTNNGHDSSWGVGVRVGYMGQLTDPIAVGVTYASKINMGDFDDYKGLFAQSGGFDIPSSFSAGISFRPTPQWLLAFDFERIFYDDALSVNNPSALIFNCVRRGRPDRAHASAAATAPASAGRTSTC